MTCKFTLVKSILCISLLLSAQQIWADKDDWETHKVNCEDPAYSKHPDCDERWQRFKAADCSKPDYKKQPDCLRGNPLMPGDPGHEQYYRQKETILQNKLKAKCKTKKTPEARQACLDNF